MTALADQRVAVITGDGVVGRSRHGVLLVHGEPDAIDALLADAPLNSVAGIERLRAVAAGSLPAGIAGMVVVTDGDGLEAVAAGPEHVSVDGATPTAQQQGSALVYRLPDGDKVRLGVPLGRARALLDLREGLVPGSGVVLAPRSEAAVRAVDTPDDDTEQWTPPELAEAAPEAGATPTGGSPLGEPVGTPAGAPERGRLVFDDGMTITLDRSYVIGRELPETGDPSLTPLVVDDDEHSVSRRHAEVRLEGWDVVVRDLGSSNGTRVWDQRATTWQRLERGEPLVLGHGTYVAVGRRVFVFEPPARD